MATATARDNPGAREESDVAWRPSPGQFVALVALMIVVVAQIVWAVLSVVDTVSLRSSVLGQESDVSGLSIVQRDSLLLLQRWDQWALEEVAADDVFVVRATLAQRLRVKTSGGVDTIDVTHQGYRDALGEVDEVLFLMVDDVADRRAFREAHRDTFADFAQATRQLSAEFQVVLAEYAQQDVAQRTRAAGIYTGLLAMSLGMLSLVVVWFGRDIFRSYRRTSERLAADLDSLNRARLQLDWVKRLDEATRSFEERVVDFPTRSGIEKHLVTVFHPLLSAASLHVHDATATLRPLEASVVGSEEEAKMNLSVVERAQEVLDRALNRDQSAKRWEFRATHDELTGLANRGHFAGMISPSDEDTPGRWEQGAVVIAVDIDRFGDLNASFGFSAGDDLLRQVARKLDHLVADRGVVGRMAADEFALVMGASTIIDARTIAETVRDALEFTAVLDGVESPVRCSVGAAWVGPGQADIASGLAEAGVALQVAKETEDFTPVFYDPVQHEDVQSSWKDDLEIHRAFRQGEFVLHFQPIVSLETGALVGSEALVRWNKPGVGVVFPGDFLPGIDRAGLTLDLGREIVEESFQAWARILSTSTQNPPPYLSINIDPKQLEDSEFSQHIIGVAYRVGIKPETVVFEVTERDLTSGEGPISHLTKLREFGFRVAVDDFGTGYSSLAQIHNLPVDIVKLDRAFLLSTSREEDAGNVIRDVVSIAERLALTVIAEGIEDDGMRHQLIGWGVGLGQGYLFSKALPEDQLVSWMASNR